MQKLTSIIILQLVSLIATAQAPAAQNLVKIHDVTSSERLDINGAEDGMLVYDKDDKTIYTYSEDGWLPLQIAPNVHVGLFVIDGSGSRSITGLPFRPSQITFSAHANIESVNIDNDNAVGNNTRGLQNVFGSMQGFARNDNGTIIQQVIFSAGHGNSINDISRYSSNSNCIGVRYGHQNGDDLGKIVASLTSFNGDGFTINVTYTNGTLTDNSSNPIVRIQPADVLSEELVVLYTAYR